MPTVYLDSHGSELVLKVARNTCPEVLEIYCKLHWSMGLVQTNPISHWPLQKSVLFSLAAPFPLLFVLFPWSSIFILCWCQESVGSACSVLRCAYMNVCERFASRWPEANLFLIPFPLQPHFYSNTLYSSGTIKYVPFVKQWLYYSGLWFF